MHEDRELSPDTSRSRLPDVSARQDVLSIRRIVISGVLGAITLLMGWTSIGFIPVPTLAGHATVMHIPAIIGGVLEGWVVGGILGLLFGLASFLQATIPIFKDPLVAILPRLFIGVTAYFAYVAIRRSGKYVALGAVVVAGALVGTLVYQIMGLFSSEPIAALVAIAVGGGVIAALIYVVMRYPAEYLALIVAAIVGTLTNSILVLGMAVVRGYLDWVAIPPILLVNVVPEIVIAIILVVAVVTAWKRIEIGSGEARM